MCTHRKPYPPPRNILAWTLPLLLFLMVGCQDDLLTAPDRLSPHLATHGINNYGDSTGFTPLNELLTGTHEGFEGGLYPGGVNEMPAEHLSAGLLKAALVEPRDLNGTPDPAGKIVLLSIGVSHASEEFCKRNESTGCFTWTFQGQTDADPSIDHDRLVLINGARGGKTAERWFEDDAQYERILNEELTPRGLSAAQVQVVWMKVANKAATYRPSLPDPEADAFLLAENHGHIARKLKVHYPNVQLFIINSRCYGGYTSDLANSPEPYAYESGFSVKWFIEAQINQMATGVVDPLVGDLNYDTGVAPWIAWGPYWWADGVNVREDGVQWPRNYFDSGGSHPSQAGEIQVGDLMFDYFLTSPYTVPWFLGQEASLFTLTATPHNDPVEIPASGGSFTFDLSLVYEGTETMTAEVWSTFEDASGVVTDGRLGPRTLTFSPGTALTKTLTDQMAGSMAPGTYMYTFCVGNHPDEVLAIATFTVIKLG